MRTKIPFKNYCNFVCTRSYIIIIYYIVLYTATDFQNNIPIKVKNNMMQKKEIFVMHIGIARIGRTVLYT